MRYLQAAGQKLVALEPDHDVIRNLVEQAGFECVIDEDRRQLILEVTPEHEGERLLLFDASAKENLGWFSRCQFYVDGLTGAVLQTPITISNCRREGKLVKNALKVALSTELPAGFRLPGRQNLSEQVVYALLYNLLNALRENGVAVCGAGSIVPLAGAGKRP